MNLLFSVFLLFSSYSFIFRARLPVLLLLSVLKGEESEKGVSADWLTGDRPPLVLTFSRYQRSKQAAKRSTTLALERHKHQHQKLHSSCKEQGPAGILPAS